MKRWRTALNVLSFSEAIIINDQRDGGGAERKVKKKKEKKENGADLLFIDAIES